MPYLLAVVKVRYHLAHLSMRADPPPPQETLRLYPVAVEVPRAPKGDDVLPLSKPIVGVSGKVYKELPIPAGTFITISTMGYNLYVYPLDPRPRMNHRAEARSIVL